jgi:hypothetical protein
METGFAYKKEEREAGRERGSNILKEGIEMGKVKESLFDVLEVALASLEGIGRAWEKGDGELLERVCKLLGEFNRTRDWENIEDLLWLTQRLREVISKI